MAAKLSSEDLASLDTSASASSTPAPYPVSLGRPAQPDKFWCTVEIGKVISLVRTNDIINYLTRNIYAVAHLYFGGVNHLHLKNRCSFGDWAQDFDLLVYEVCGDDFNADEVLEKIREDPTHPRITKLLADIEGREDLHYDMSVARHVHWKPLNEVEVIVDEAFLETAHEVAQSMYTLILCIRRQYGGSELPKDILKIMDYLLSEASDEREHWTTTFTHKRRKIE